MKQPKTIASFSIEQDIKDGIDQLSEQEQRSKSDILRDMYRSYRFHSALDNIQAEGRIIAARLGLETEDEVYRYLNEN
jgi:metal-responsive CopG/Arc/MetJ family transcriptional regulator